MVVADAAAEAVDVEDAVHGRAAVALADHLQSAGGAHACNPRHTPFAQPRPLTRTPQLRQTTLKTR